jgi:Protein of unknown function (DUF2806)
VSNEIIPSTAQTAIERFIEKLNLPEMIAGPAGKAISRLVAGVVEIPAAYLDSFAQSIKDKTAAKTQVNKEVAAAAAKLAAGDVDIVARAAHNLLAKEYRRQKNKEEIARKAVEILQDETKTLRGTGPAPQGDANQPPPPPNVDDDWLNVFERYAEEASTERLQELWARILAGEIRRPKTFSLKTLRFVSELDQETAALFEKHAPYICQNAIITRQGLSGNELTELLHLQDAGLLTGVGGLINQTINLGPTGQAIMQNQNQLLSIRGQPNQTVQFPVAMLTKIAMEIMQITKVPFNRDAGREIADRIPKGGLKEIAYLAAQPSPNGFRLTPVEILWTEPAQPNASA